jgi:hypothetical protein
MYGTLIFELKHHGSSIHDSNSQQYDIRLQSPIRNRGNVSIIR